MQPIHELSAIAARPSVSIDCHRELQLCNGWQTTACAAGTHLDPRALDDLAWLPARVPGTAAAALLAAGRWRPGQEIDLDIDDWWFRTRFQADPVEAEEEVALELDGVATVAEVFLNGVKLLASGTMFAAHTLDVSGVLEEENDLAIRCCALAPLLRERRKPRARWRTRLVDANLRFFRTALLGRAAGFAPGPAAVGPWRPVRLVRRRSIAVQSLRIRTRIGADRFDAAGEVSARLQLRCIDRAPVQSVELEVAGPSGTHREALALRHEAGGALADGTVTIPQVARWWPHTHGEPALHDVRIHVKTASGRVTAHAGRVGFRALAAGAAAEHDVEADGLDLHLNGVRIFARGAVWTPADFVGLAPEPDDLRAALEQVRDAGMNMLRIPGTSMYESRAFHDLCDELGLLVWQDFMFANLDYPISNAPFRATVEREAKEQLEQLAPHPSLVVLCGNSEIEQQVAMLGLDPALGRGELFGELLPALIAEADADAVYVPSAPCGGSLPFRTNRGVANYYGVGGYRRPLHDVRLAAVRFASECLAFSNVPDESGVEAILPDDPRQIAVHHPRWKAGVPRDSGTGWDFEDVRDHYLKLLFDIDPGELRRFDHDRYLELSRVVTGEVMAEVFGEWRRGGSPCGGGLVLWLKDLAPGAGWGLIDHSGAPKPAYHHLRRALAPICVWTSDEGLNGICVHVANDRPSALSARLRVALYRNSERPAAEAHELLELPAHSLYAKGAEELMGHFVDVSWAYRFGPPSHHVLVATLEGTGDDEILGQAFRFIVERPLHKETPAALGLEGALCVADDGPASIMLRSRRLVYGVRVHARGLLASDDAFSLEPGVARRITLADPRPVPGPVARPAGTTRAAAAAASHERPPITISAVNLDGQLRL